MPKLSDTMTEGKLIAWKKTVGDKVERGEIVAEVETDKATMELEAFASGVLLETRVKAGEMVPVGKVIGIIGKEGEKGAKEEKKETPPPEKEEPEKEAPAEAKEAPAGKPEEAPAEEKRPTPAESAEEAPPPVEEKVSPEAPPVPSEVGEEKASPLVRRLAREKGIDLRKVSGSGPEGRILQDDLEGFLRKQEGVKVKVEEKPSKPEPARPSPEGAVQPLSRMRAAVARTVAEAWRTIPHFAVTMAIDMGEAERVRQELKDSGAQISLNDLIVKGCALAIGKFPLVNASFGADGITPHAEVNIGIAVALEDGLLVPVVKGCRGLSLKEIAARSRELVERARSGKITEQEISGGTFSISNLGMYGVDEFMAVIHPPQGAILAVGGVADQPVIRGGHLTAARIMRVTLSCDHRLLDGAYAAQFLAELKRVLENPVAMLL